MHKKNVFSEVVAVLCGSVVKHILANAGATDLIPGLGGSPRGENANHSLFLPGKSHLQRKLEGSSHGVARIGHY